MDRLHIALRGHRQVGLDHHRHDAPVGRHGGNVQLDVAVLHRPVAEELLQDLLHLPRHVVAGPWRTERGEATHGEGEERETRRVEEYAARETRHTVTTIGSSQPPGKFAYWDSVSHVVTACDTEDRHAIAARCHYRARPRRRGGGHPNHAGCAPPPPSPLRRRPEHGGRAGGAPRAAPEPRPGPPLATRGPPRPSAAAEVPLLRGDRG